jgi:hypothetical protein
VVGATPRNGPSSFFFPSSMVSDGTSFVLLGQQHSICGDGTAETICRHNAVAARLAPDGSGLDAQSFPLNVNSALDTLSRKFDRFIAPGVSVFDGSSYLLPFVVASYSYTEAPKLVFLARLRPDGSLVDGEDEGLLVHAQWSNVDPTPEVAVDALQALVVFRDAEYDGAGGGDEVPHHALDRGDRDVRRQRAEHPLHRRRLDLVVLLRPGPVGRDVVHGRAPVHGLARAQPGLAQGLEHGRVIRGS